SIIYEPEFNENYLWAE
nr:Chain E, Peptide from E3 ubiquitin-protein ligase substrate receptor MMS22 [Saccharomyces cerevisiae S288C]6J0X_F Chain F, Peptide from E3 ubiquitin-protein ligase substrate receptor MMS22 [Saccharomyces cerevisiae S288C]6J0X_G Chain G, Peptide from E3 ubiquitin-protein ligase substrate receptor MMS22 [Saccharomyces cerevisiae S288C]6J0X_H Chain H, Peptide from E3 ubiquitin-protein ligase substrate receptor MMS22 [Saccharomyces cerevisiae S288C]